MANARELQDEGMALLEAASAQRRVEHAASEVRLARFKHAAVLEGQGRYEEAKVILDEIRVEQEQVGLAEREGNHVRTAGSRARGGAGQIASDRLPSCSASPSGVAGSSPAAGPVPV